MRLSEAVFSRGHTAVKQVVEQKLEARSAIGYPCSKFIIFKVDTCMLASAKDSLGCWKLIIHCVLK